MVSWWMEGSTSTMTLLKNQIHMTTHRHDGRIIKTAKDGEGMVHLSNETAFLATMAPSGYVPKVLGHAGTVEAPTAIELEDLGDTEEVTNTDELLTHAIHLLNSLRRSRIYHGDLTAPNLIIRDNKPYAIDFGESLDLDAPPTRQSKRPEPDWFHMLQAIQNHGDPRRIIRRWLAIRESLGTASLEGKSLMDFGCHEGYMVALAAADGASGLGWDSDQIVCANACTRWAELPMSEKQFPLTFLHHDLDYFRRHQTKTYDIGLCLSTYPYLIQKVGEELARHFLFKVVMTFGVLFFEAQSSGDGPGPAFWKDQDAVGEYLTVFGKVEEVCRLDIGGRDAERVTWKVTKN